MGSSKNGTPPNPKQFVITAMCCGPRLSEYESLHEYMYDADIYADIDIDTNIDTVIIDIDLEWYRCRHLCA